MPDEPTTPEPPAKTTGGEERWVSALLRPSRKQVMVAILLGILGFAAVTQVRVTESDTDYSALRQQQLIDVLDALAGTRQRTQAEIERLEEQREDLRDSTSQRRAAIDAARDDIDDLNILAGLVPVTGPGIRVTVEEVTGRVRTSSLIDVIQELRTAEAEAIQINGSVRVVAQTGIERVTGGFLIDGQRVEPPYLIEAIGEPAALAGAMDTRVGAGAGLVDDGATVEVVELNSLDITAVRELDDPQFATPD